MSHLCPDDQIGIKRQGKLLLRNKQFIRVHIMQDVLMGLIVGSLFWQTDKAEFQLRIGSCFADD
jgi:hypothetical protein